MLTSSIGRKSVMAVTGLLLIGFLIEHLLGNLKLLEDPSGRAFDDYVEFMKSFGPLLVAAEVGLAALFLAHVYLAFRLTLENWQARKERYVVRRSMGASSPGSITMFYSGALLLGYLLKHLYDFRFDHRFFADPDALVKAKMSQPQHAVVYVLGALVLGFHLSHGFRSALQTLGVNHPTWNPILERAGTVLAVLFALGFAAFPVYFLFLWKGGAAS